MKIVGFIFARGGSKGIKNKNIKDLCGKELIFYSIQAAKDSGVIDRLFVSTDSKQIADVALKYGAEVPFIRPQYLAEDDSPEWLSWQHAVKEVSKQLSFDIFVSIPTTAPLRTGEDLKRCVDFFCNNKKDIDLLLTCSKSQRHPMFNMYKVDTEGYTHRYTEVSPIITRRQNAPQVYDGTTIAYISTPKFILNNSSIWDGRVKSLEFSPETSIDLDNNLDWKIAEMLMKERNCHEND